jgi:hypothetical protein
MCSHTIAHCPGHKSFSVPNVAMLLIQQGQCAARLSCLTGPAHSQQHKVCSAHVPHTKANSTHTMASSATRDIS